MPALAGSDAGTASQLTPGFGGQRRVTLGGTGSKKVSMLRNRAVALAGVIMLAACGGNSISPSGAAPSPPPIASATLFALDLNPTSVTGGGRLQGTATLTGPAPSGGAVISLSSSSAVVTVPASVIVAPAATSTTFAVTIGTVFASTSATITGAFGGVTKIAALTVTDARSCSPWPAELSEMLAKLPVPDGLCLIRMPGSGPSYYDAGSRASVYVSPSPVHGELGAISHENGHAHQHRVALDAGTSGELLGWLATAEGSSFVDIVGWRRDGVAWTAPCECNQNCGPTVGPPNPLEDAAQYIAFWYNPGGVFNPIDLRRNCPRHYQWLERWIPQ